MPAFSNEVLLGWPPTHVCESKAARPELSGLPDRELMFHKALDLYRKMLASAWTEHQTDPMDAQSITPARVYEALSKSSSYSLSLHTWHLCSLELSVISKIP